MNKRTSRVLIAAAGLTALALTATGCSSTAGSSGEAGTVGATLLSLEYPFLVNLEDAMKTTAGEEGLALVSLDPRQEVATELTQVEDLITRNVDAIVMIPVDQKTSQAAAEKINAADIPLILVNTRFAEDYTGDYVSYIGSDDTEAGQIEAEYANEQLPDGGEIVYLVGQYGGASTERRKAGFVDNLSDDITIATEIEAHGSRAEAKTIMEDLLRRYPAGDIVGVVAQSDEMAIGAASAIAEAGREDEFVIVIGVDGSEAGLDAVEDGTLTATVFQDAVGQGTTAMETAAKVLAGETVEKEILIPFQLVTADNLSDFR